MEKVKLSCGCEIEVERNKSGKIVKSKVPDNPRLDCDKTWNIYKEGLTWGVFQLETQGGQHWSEKVAPENINELSDLIAVIRPGCKDAIINGKSVTNRYIDRKRGVEKVEYLDPLLEEATKNSQGFIIFQETAMEVSKQIAGFDGATAYKLCKAAAKKNVEAMAKMKELFFAGARERGHSDEDIERIFSGIEASQRYSFNKCVCPETTTVKTPTGWIPIKDLKPGMAIMDHHDDYVKVNHIYDNGTAEVFRVYFNNNSWLDCTLSHRLLCEDLVSRPVSFIQSNSLNVWYRDADTNIENLLKINKIESLGIKSVVDIEVDNYDHVYLANGGICTHNSHSVSYSLDSYIFSAYLKAHFPRAFYMGKLEFIGDNEKLAELLEDAPKMGVEILPPDIRFFNDKPLLKDKQIIFPLTKIKGVSNQELAKIKKNMIGLLDSENYLDWIITGAHKVNKTAMEGLICVGAYDHLGLPRQRLLDEYLIFKGLKKAILDRIMERKSDGAMIALNEILEEGTGKDKLLFNKTSFSGLKNKVKLLKLAQRHSVNDLGIMSRWEKNLLGREVTCTELDNLGVIGSNTCLEIFNIPGSKKQLDVPVIIRDVKRHICKDGRTMAFLTVYDLTTSINNVVLFADAYEKYSSYLFQNSTVHMYGSKGFGKGFVVTKINPIR